MAKECFCGCGRTVPRFPLGMRSINTRGQQVKARLEWAEENGVRNAEDSDWWFEEGAEHVRELSAAMHGELDPRTLDERPVRAWQAFGREAERRQIKGMANLGRAVRKSGMDADEAMKAMAAAMERGMSIDDILIALEQRSLPRA